MGCGSGQGPSEPGLAGARPFEPAPLAQPYVDTAFRQEQNHTTNEVDANLPPPVSVVLPPAGVEGYLAPIQIDAHGATLTTSSGIQTRIDFGGTFGEIEAATTVPNALLFLASGVVVRATLVGDGGDGTDVFSPPDGVSVRGIASVGSSALLLTSAGVGSIGLGDPVWPAPGGPIATAAAARGNEAVIAGDGFVAGYPLDAAIAGALASTAPRWRIDAAHGLTVGAVRAIVTDVKLPRALDVVVIGDAGLQAVAIQSTSGSTVAKLVDVPEFHAGRVPLGGSGATPRAAAVTADGGFVVATSGGAYRAIDRGDGFEWRVYPAERWLPSEDVRAVATDPSVPDGPIWFATAKGLGTATASSMTLEQKLGPFVDRIVKRHDRDGAVADSHLLVRGDLSSNVPWDSDNDGGWTSYWLLGECYRWKTTGADDAKANFDQSLEGMLRLTEETGTDYFLARSVIRKAGCNLDDCDNPDDGHWYTSPDGEWWVKRDTSNDEVISHDFMMGPAYDLCADPSQRARIRTHIANVIGGIMDHGWQLIDPITNQVTTYGQFDPGYVDSPVGGRFADGGQRALAILAGLTEAYYMTGDPRFLDGKSDLIANHGYADDAEREADYPLRSGTYSGDGDELSAQGWFALLRYEQDPALRARWLDGWNRHYAHTKLQQGALWDTVNGVVGGDVAPGFANAARWLRTAPVDMIRWNIHNWQRLDLAPPPHFYAGIGRQRSDGKILPYDERACERWNTSQYRMDGGLDAMIEMDGADVLAPYWMARYYGYIAPAP